MHLSSIEYICGNWNFLSNLRRNLLDWFQTYQVGLANPLAARANKWQGCSVGGCSWGCRGGRPSFCASNAQQGRIILIIIKNCSLFCIITSCLYLFSFVVAYQLDYSSQNRLGLRKNQDDQREFLWLIFIHEINKIQKQHFALNGICGRTSISHLMQKVYWWWSDRSLQINLCFLLSLFIWII